VRNEAFPEAECDRHPTSTSRYSDCSPSQMKTITLQPLELLQSGQGPEMPIGRGGWEQQNILFTNTQPFGTGAAGTANGLT
jgi:hypothetical protein